MATTVKTPLNVTDLSDNPYQGLPEEIRKEKRKDTYEVDPRLILADHADNWRTEYGDLEVLKQVIRENGVPGELLGRREKVDGVDHYRVFKDGFRRAKAIEELLKEGIDPGYVGFRILSKDYTEEQRVKDMLISNGGKPFTPLEEGRIYVELEEKYEYSRKQIGKTFGKSEPHVCNMIQLAKNGGSLVEAVEAGEISTTSAVKVMKVVPEEQRRAVVDRGLEIAGTRGKSKATDKDLAQAASELMNMPAADESMLENDELPPLPEASTLPQLFDGVDDVPHVPARVPAAPDPSKTLEKREKSVADKIGGVDPTMKKLLKVADSIKVDGRPNISQQTVNRLIDFLNGKIEMEELVEFVNE